MRRRASVLRDQVNALAKLRHGVHAGGTVPAVLRVRPTHTDNGHTGPTGPPVHGDQPGAVSLRWAARSGHPPMAGVRNRPQKRQSMLTAYSRGGP